MKQLLYTLFSVVLLATLGLAASGERKAPEFDAKKWYNTAPLKLEDLQGKVVHIQVFRTW